MFSAPILEHPRDDFAVGVELMQYAMYAVDLYPSETMGLFVLSARLLCV